MAHADALVQAQQMLPHLFHCGVVCHHCPGRGHDRTGLDAPNTLRKLAKRDKVRWRRRILRGRAHYCDERNPRYHQLVLRPRQE
jgi:hypothetical protein